jgi:hypothetical protein
MGYSSPEEALKVLKANPEDKFLDLDKQTLRGLWLNGNNYSITRLVNDCDNLFRRENLSGEESTEAQTAHTNLNLKKSMIGSDGIVVACRPENLTNAVVYETIQNTPKLKIINELITERMQKTTELLNLHFKETLPQ